jgi:hypothetical protein
MQILLMKILQKTPLIGLAHIGELFLVLIVLELKQKLKSITMKVLF